MAFAADEREPPAIEVRVNFGVYAGREATLAEIDRLAAWLLDEVGEVSIISEQRHSSTRTSKHPCTRYASRSQPIAHRPTRRSEPRWKSGSSNGPSTGRGSCVAERHVEITTA